MGYLDLYFSNTDRVDDMQLFVSGRVTSDV